MLAENAADLVVRDVRFERCFSRQGFGAVLQVTDGTATISGPLVRDVLFLIKPFASMPHDSSLRSL